VNPVTSVVSRYARTLAGRRHLYVLLRRRVPRRLRYTRWRELRAVNRTSFAFGLASCSFNERRWVSSLRRRSRRFWRR